MTNFTKNMTIAAAALLVAAGVAGAQTIKAEVPFSFRAAGTVMPAGSYLVTAGHQSGGSHVFRFTQEDSNRTIMALPESHNNLKRGATPISLTFECTGTDCALAGVAPSIC